uniref:Bap2(1) n=1 Tax=Schizophyllum commune TaxID=5334 RepID=Q9UVW2_SCHCO|nr:Bap2(1) [Schizophyllum commune]
MDVTGHCDKA